MAADTEEPYRGQAATEIARGTLRLLSGLGFYGVPEMTLANHRRADLAVVNGKGEIWMVEIKSSVADFKSDAKWTEYKPYCDRFWFAVNMEFPQELIPEDVGLIVADAFGGAVIRHAPEDRLSAARRKAVTLRLGRLAAMRLTQAADTGWTAGPDTLTSPLP